MTARVRGARTLRTLVLLGAAAASACTAGCATGQRDPYAAELESAAHAATSSLEREILADRRITRAEYDAAVDAYVRCMESSGYTVHTVDHGGAYTFTLDHSGSDVDADDAACARGTTGLVGVIYIQQFLNPAKEDLDDVVARCLVRHGAVDEDYDGRRLEAERADGAEPSYDLDDPEVAACFMNPQA